ncbi:MAG: phage tail protein [Algicola sp.]|nr:phage tail protein [Algicola sp.]
MNVFTSLENHLRASNLFASEQFDCWVQGGEISASSEFTADGLTLGEMHTDGFYSIERFNGDEKALLGQVMCWLINNDIEETPTFDVDPLGNGLIDIIIGLRLSEKIDAVEDEDGPLEVKGVRYKLGEHTVWYAESVNVTGAT